MSDDVEVLARRRGYERHFKLDELKLRHRLFAGGWSAVLDRELIDRGDAVGVIPFDVERNAVVMVEQFRLGAMGHGHSPWLLEFVAGLVESGESPLEVARREALEEANLTLLEIETVGTYFMSPGGSTERLHLMCGRTQAPAAGGIHGLADEGEDIKVHVLELDQAIGLLSDGTPLPAWTALALQWLDVNGQRLRELWRFSQ